MTQPLSFHAVGLNDLHLHQKHAENLLGMNCDLNFMNIFSWQFLYQTEVAERQDLLVYRFVADGHTAYMMMCDKGRIGEVLDLLVEEAGSMSHPFLLMGVNEETLPMIEAARPDYFMYEYNRNYCDYIYRRESLATLTGKKLQPKRNHVNKFCKSYPGYEYHPLTPNLFDACLDLDAQWMDQEADEQLPAVRNERLSMMRVFENWEQLGGLGGAVTVNGELVAFTYGAEITPRVFDVCVEKAHPFYEGAFALINREFVRHLPEQYELINREEDLGLKGLRQSKLSYHPEILLKKYAVMARHHFHDGKVL